MNAKRDNTPSPLEGLKDFQQRTVEYVFKQFYGENRQSRFLVADEVGLGKTMVARGIIAKTIEFLRQKTDRIDIIYICSNATIATQNIKRLNGGHHHGVALATRLTFLPQIVRSLRFNKLNFISLTPGTAFDHTLSRGGQMRERTILYHMLYALPLAQGERREQLRYGLYSLLQATAGKGGWERDVELLDPNQLDADLSRSFRREVMNDRDLYAQLKSCCARFYAGNISEEDSRYRYDLIGKLRNKLASVCLSALDPDLVILDEFQRFKSLLNGDDDAALLAKALFEHPEVRVLLLSATPYKMYTTEQESEEENHYKDFIATLHFLFNDAQKVAEIEQQLLGIRTSLQGSGMRVSEKAQLENALLQVMCRTERIATTRNLNAMTLEDVRTTPLTVADLQHAATLDAIAQSVNAADPIEYWKSAPYLLNFLKSYDLRNKLDKSINAPAEPLQKALKNAKKQWLTKAKVERYKPLNAANPRMRMLFDDTLNKEMWQLLWMPPSLSYTQPSGFYKDKQNLTKALVFSRWSAVPDAIAAVCSYEAERRMVDSDKIPHSKLTTKTAQLLRFSAPSGDARLTGMPVLAWMLPSPTLANVIDPLTIALEEGGKPLTTRKMRAAVRKQCASLLSSLGPSKRGSRPDERWYWAALAMLDNKAHYLQWLTHNEEWSTGDSETSEPFQEHLALYRQAANGELDLGPRPKDIADVLCDLALAAPGTCALRTLNRFNPTPETIPPALFSAAFTIASGFRTLFNLPETISLLRGVGDNRYWRLTLQYGIDGNLQAVLDEYAHILLESLGLQQCELPEQAAAIAECMHSVLSLRTAQMHIDEFKTRAGGYELIKFSTRCRFALRYGDIKNDDSSSNARAEVVKDAFNSPFRPFVLASTSIGQEGLDFHSWCHAVMHWNLPSNPVDMEQREGRVHRYKGHAVRKNVAEYYGLGGLKNVMPVQDPWKALFALAARDRQPSQSELIPYWIFENGSAQVERRVPMLPYSRESKEFKQLKQDLALYRLAFGQPRQEDLLFCIQRGGELTEKDVSGMMISLVPPDARGK
ncbi:helicase-related protein [Pseudocitrobacter faecalis]|uniref:helicase-related protein n=1 Tax=Pseudocitrobacter faecalis TaxID=1398493 RepID=UPI0039F102AE